MRDRSDIIDSKHQYRIRTNTTSHGHKGTTWLLQDMTKMQNKALNYDLSATTQQRQQQQQFEQYEEVDCLLFVVVNYKGN